MGISGRVVEIHGPRRRVKYKHSQKSKKTQSVKLGTIEAANIRFRHSNRSGGRNG
jgi:hypothetical protein